MTIRMRPARTRAGDEKPSDARSVRTGLDSRCPPKADCAAAGFRKEVIQPQVLLRLPCYDFTPIMSHTLGACLPACAGLARRLLVQLTFVM